MKNFHRSIHPQNLLWDLKNTKFWILSKNNAVINSIWRLSTLFILSYKSVFNRSFEKRQCFDAKLMSRCSRFLLWSIDTLAHFLIFSQESTKDNSIDENIAWYAVSNNIMFTRICMSQTNIMMIIINHIRTGWNLQPYHWWPQHA